MRRIVAPLAIVLALSGCARRPNHTAAYIADGVLVGVGGIGLLMHDDPAGGDDPGYGPVEYIYLGLVAAGVIGAGITYIINAGPDPED